VSIIHWKKTKQDKVVQMPFCVVVH